MPTVDSATLERLRRSTVATEDVWFLSGPTQPGEGVVHTPVDGNPYVVGRTTGVSLKLQFRTVSGRHAALWIDDGALWLRDLGSTNGTYVNGVRLKPENEYPLSHGNIISLGKLKIQFLMQITQ